jgi:hypothetical protein
LLVIVKLKLTLYDEIQCHDEIISAIFIYQVTFTTELLTAIIKPQKLAVRKESAKYVAMKSFRTNIHVDTK